MITLINTLPVQVDGEAWQQIPCTMEITLLPTQALLLSKSTKPHYQKGLTNRQARSLIDKSSETAALIDDANFSSRRTRQELKKGSSASALLK